MSLGSWLTPHLMSPFHQNQICRLSHFPVSGQVSDLYENKLHLLKQDKRGELCLYRRKLSREQMETVSEQLQGACLLSQEMLPVTQGLSQELHGDPKGFPESASESTGTQSPLRPFPALLWHFWTHKQEWKSSVKISFLG